MNTALLRRIAAEKRRILLPLAIAGGAAILLYAIVVFPVGRKVQTYEREAREAGAALRLARQDEAGARGLVRGKTQADAELRRFYRDVLPATQSDARQLTYLKFAQIARQADVHASSGTSEVTREKGSPLAKVTSTFVLAGDYRNVRRFIYTLETDPEFVVLEDLSLAHGRDQDDRGLAVNLRVSTYFRASDGD